MVQKSKSSNTTKYWWLFVSFFGPFIAVLLISQATIVKYFQVESISLVLVAVLTAVRSGLVGLATACFIYFLWKLDFWLGKPWKADRREAKLISLLGVFLWLAWFGLSQMVFIASDELSFSNVKYGAYSHGD